ncbi:hypothetical protein AK812_SmicGene42719 [Symbiodinium microadriaticum]|uniref:Sushi domain-containing protein n=1 Tax=Symbiodinium microadriaticum TaxID=2951 RepID=A0A1Q9C2U6_SYMMI|nr:hypothetical protein AK812_SmicGene42719 [Symbiodinium microadriaticum]
MLGGPMFTVINETEVYEDGLFCPQDNVDPLKEVEVRQIPTCELFCPSPPPPPGCLPFILLRFGLQSLGTPDGTPVSSMPEERPSRIENLGYIKLHDLLLETENGTEINRDPAYTCAPGWTGTPNHTCSVNSDLETNIAEYTGPAPGTICQLSCREPMRGDVTTASCVERNIDPRRRMEYDLCNMYCPAPEVIPEGATAGNVSNSTIQLPDGANVASIEYRCAPGYAGLAQISCHLQGSYSSATGTVECVTVTSFSGCKLHSTFGGTSEHVPLSGRQRESPRAGPEPRARTALPLSFWEQKVDSTQLVLGELPSCRFPFGCEEPVPLTQGYVKVNESSYECAEGYVGEDQICGLNYTACTGTGPGQMCRVPCLAGYIENTSYVWEEDEMEMEEQMMTNNISMAGYLLSNHFYDCLPDNATEPSCPAGNIDPTKVIEFERIRCEFQVCIDPHPTPLGYTKLPNGTWTCQRGFVGEVVKECHVCNASLALSGLCPSDNTDPTFEFNFTMPHCELTCHSPDPVPEGYVLAESGEWQCAESYSGKAEYHCELMSECWSMASLSGYAPLACDVPTVEFCTHVEIGCNASLPAGQDKQVLLHTDSACAYKAKTRGVLHASVVHGPQEAPGVGRWKVGTQVVDRAWKFIKSRLTLNQNSKVGSTVLISEVRSAQFEYWHRGRDMWERTGELLSWHVSQIMTK